MISLIYFIFSQTVQFLYPCSPVVRYGIYIDFFETFTPLQMAGSLLGWILE